MAGYTHMISDPQLAQLADRAGNKVTGAIQKASARTQVDFAYLMEKASAESSFRPEIEAKTSSATGLFQFIESTWLRMVDRYGEKHGLGEYADMIDGNGRVGNSADKQAILDLRKDPEVASLMAAEFASENKRVLESRVGGDIGPTELYLAHFLGAGGASEFLNARANNPDLKAAALMPQAAKANKNVFYHTDGRQKSLDDIYAFFDKKFGQKADVKHVDPDQELPKDKPVKRRLSPPQQAFIPHQYEFDRAVTQLLLSPSFHEEAFQQDFLSGSYMNLLDFSSFLMQNT